MGREQNVIIFKDTERLVKENQTLADAVKHSNRQQILITEEMPVEEVIGVLHEDRYAQDAAITVSKKRTFEAASAYAGKKVCVHNFASATNPGGGVVKGSSAQEECLCRCSTLYFSLSTKDMWDGFYGPHRAAQDPLHNDDCIYTPDVVAFKTDTASPTLMEPDDWYKVNVITCAAPNLRLMPANRMNPGDGNKRAKISDEELFNIHTKRFRRILDVAAAAGNEVLILGAFGCGAFENNPSVVARAAKEVVQDYRKCFETIEFAVYCTPRDEQNYRIFKGTLKHLWE